MPGPRSGAGFEKAREIGSRVLPGGFVTPADEDLARFGPGPELDLMVKEFVYDKSEDAPTCPSTDMRDSFELVDFLFAQTGSFLFNYRQEDGHGAAWASFNPVKHWESFGKTGAHAICLAALKARKIKVPFVSEIR